MFNKVYEKIKKFLKENLFSIGIIVLVYSVCTIEFPYYIDAPGSLISTKDRISIENSYESVGSFHMVSVSEIKGILPTLLWAFIDKNMDIVKKEEKVYNDETYDEANLRSRLLLNNSLDNAVFVAYQYAGKEVKMIDEKVYVTLVYKEANTDLKVGDQILKIDGEEINNTTDLKMVLETKEFEEEVSILVNNQGEEKTRKAIIQNIDGKKYLGISVMLDYDLEVEPEIEFSFKGSESGSSGGLMLSLAIYNSLVEEDITKGKKIVGTGTMEIDGSVGAIGGVKYKLAAAVKEGAKIFIVPKDNYEEAKQVVERNNYDIKLLETSSFEETLEKLKQI